MKIFCNHQPQQKCPINLNQEQISVRLPLPGHIPSDCLLVIAMNQVMQLTVKRPNQAFTGGFALCTRSKVQCTGLHLSTERRDRTDARADRSSDPRGPRSDSNSKVHPADGFFRYDDRISSNSCSEICEGWILLFWQWR